MKDFDVKKVKEDFPIFGNHPDLVYLDSAATSQKPRVVIEAVRDFYEKENANVHRGIYDLSQGATELFEASRKKVAGFIGAENAKEIVFTSGATEGINLVAYGWGRKFLRAGDVVVLSEMEHHSNIVPWLRLREEVGVELVFLGVTDEGMLDWNHELGIMNQGQVSFQKTRNTQRSEGQNVGRSELSDKNEIAWDRVKMVALTHASNVLGVVNPIAEIVSFFRENSPDVKVLIDGAQFVPHSPIVVKELGCDFFVFSSHKMLGPSGVGVLWGRQELLEEMDPLLVGSHMIKKVTKKGATWADVPDKFEAGTRNLEGVVGLGAAVDYLQKVGMENVAAYERGLTEYALRLFEKQENVLLFGPRDLENRLGVFSFNVGDVHAHDAAEVLNRVGVAVRAGHHCAQVLMERLGVAGTVRASVGVYNTREDIDRLFEGIELVRKTFRMSKS